MKILMIFPFLIFFLLKSEFILHVVSGNIIRYRSFYWNEKSLLTSSACVHQCQVTILFAHCVRVRTYLSSAWTYKRCVRTRLIVLYFKFTAEASDLVGTYFATHCKFVCICICSRKTRNSAVKSYEHPTTFYAHILFDFRLEAKYTY